MRRRLRVTGLLLIALTVGSNACSTAPPAYVRPEPRITPDNTEHPKRIRFDVYGDPFSPAAQGTQEASLRVHEQIRLGMRRYAAEKLRELNYCPRGFSGPDVILSPERKPLVRFFYVECL